MPSEKPTPVTLPPGVPESSCCRIDALEAVFAERDRQDIKWGVSRNLHPQLWMPVVAEELGEANKAILKGDPENYLEELVHTAAVALAAVQDFLWQREFGDRLPPPQVVAFAWERADRGEGDGGRSG